jgi:hypothetical protein
MRMGDLQLADVRPLVIGSSEGLRAHRTNQRMDTSTSYNGEYHYPTLGRQSVSDDVMRTAGIILVLIPTVVWGGASILWLWLTRQADYYDNPLRQRLWRAGHAHAGVLLVLSLVALVLLDATSLGDGWRTLVRTTIPGSAILLPAAFFLSVAKPDAQRPNGLINLAYVGALSLVVGTLTLGVGLLAA